MIVYLNDILVYSEDLAHYVEQVKEVLHTLRNNNLFTKLEKCVFSQKSVEYLGFIIFSEGIKMDPAWVDTVAS